jgi:hypothetical protein
VLASAAPVAHHAPNHCFGIDVIGALLAGMEEEAFV